MEGKKRGASTFAAPFRVWSPYRNAGVRHAFNSVPTNLHCFLLQMTKFERAMSYGTNDFVAL
jgi:hypothetical protein